MIAQVVPDTIPDQDKGTMEDNLPANHARAIINIQSDFAIIISFRGWARSQNTMEKNVQYSRQDRTILIHSNEQGDPIVLYSIIQET